VKLFSGLTERLRDGLKRSQEYLSQSFSAVLEPGRPITEELYEELEEVLIAADLGAAIAADFTNRAREEAMFGTVTRADQLRPLFRRFLIDTFAGASQPIDTEARPTVLLMLGVNGSGKTTTCAKLASRYALRWDLSSSDRTAEKTILQLVPAGAQQPATQLSLSTSFTGPTITASLQWKPEEPSWVIGEAVSLTAVPRPPPP